MSYKTILVHFDGSRQRRERLELAFNMAERFDAHLVAQSCSPSDLGELRATFRSSGW
jgi:hypothetical protein